MLWGGRMICSKCENINDNPSSNFCYICGGLLVREEKNIEIYKRYYANKKAIESKSKLLKRLVSLAVIIALLVCMNGYKLQRDVGKFVNMVKEGSFENHPNVTIEDGFEKFFNDTNWEYVNSDNGYDTVEFRGSFNYENQDVLTVMQFHIYEDNTFEPNYLSFVDVSQEKNILYDLINTVMSSY